MNIKILAICFCLGMIHVQHARAGLKVFACEPEWASLAREIGGAEVETDSATQAMQDPHYIEARPSLIAHMRKADLVVCTGAQLEIGWLPLLLNKANNPAVLPGKPGFFEARAYVTMLDVPAGRVDRRQRQMCIRDRASEQDDHQIALQYIMSIGAHGAHSF